MSDSELSAPPTLPTDDQIERELRRVVRELNKHDEEVTVNIARARAEVVLGLDAGYLKDRPEWKARSKSIIQDSVELEGETSSPEPPTKPSPKPKAKPASKAGSKRKSEDDKSAEEKRPTKKSRKIVSEGDASESESSEVEQGSNRPSKRASRKTKASIRQLEDTDDSDHLDTLPAQSQLRSKDEARENEVRPRSKEPAHQAKNEDELSDAAQELEKDQASVNGNPTPAEDSESDMSSLIDEPPAKKKRQKKATATETTPKSRSTSKSKGSAQAKAGKVSSAEDEEVKRLQGWLIKCGIRKMWWKELAPYSNAKDKIRHLKKMLGEAGMSGRYSNEKAKQIKESRELAAELEAVEEFNDRWGQSDEEGNAEEHAEDAAEEKAESAPTKRMPKGFIDFGDSGDDGSD